MEQRNHEGPYGYFRMTEDYTILEANETFLHLLGYDLAGLRGCQFETILTRASRLFFHLHFSPLIKLNHKIDEMHLSLRPLSGNDIPVLLQAARLEREGTFDFECTVAVLGDVRA